MNHELHHDPGNTMKLKNYTSTVPVERTISRIEKVISDSGATGIMKEYAGGELVSLSFHTTIASGRNVAVRLPANADAVYTNLRSRVKKPRKGTEVTLRMQANRTAWKLMQDWVEVQVSLIQLQQADFLEVFLPYIWDGRQTFYAAIKAQNYKALPLPREE